jgi:hypothetical protein
MRDDTTRFPVARGVLQRGEHYRIALRERLVVNQTETGRIDVAERCVDDSLLAADAEVPEVRSDQRVVPWVVHLVPIPRLSDEEVERDGDVRMGWEICR